MQARSRVPCAAPAGHGSNCPQVTAGHLKQPPETEEAWTHSVTWAEVVLGAPDIPRMWHSGADWALAVS